MGFKLVWSGEDNKFDRDDLFNWIAVIGMIVFLGVEAYDKMVGSIKISEWAYLTLIALAIGRPAIAALFHARLGNASKKE